MKQENKQPVYCVIFDMDGILADTAPFHLEAWKRFGDKYNKHISREFFFRTFGMENMEIFKMIFGTEMQADMCRALSEEKEALFRDCIGSGLKPFAGVMEFIRDLCRNNVLAAVGSSGPRSNVSFIIRELGLEPLICGYICGDQVSRGKPAPDIFLKAAEIAAVKPSDCLVVEDSLVGIDAACAAGMTCVAVTNTESWERLHKANYVVHSLVEMDARRAVEMITMAQKELVP